MSAWQVCQGTRRAAAKGCAVATQRPLALVSKENELLPSRHPRDQSPVNSNRRHVQGPRLPCSCRENAQLRGLAGQKGDGVLTIRSDAYCLAFTKLHRCGRAIQAPEEDEVIMACCLAGLAKNDALTIGRQCSIGRITQR